MNKIMNILHVIANIAICTSLLSDTYHRFGATKRKKEVTSSLDDEYDNTIWAAGGTYHHCPWRGCIHVEGHQKISDDAEEENQ